MAQLTPQPHGTAGAFLGQRLLGIALILQGFGFGAYVAWQIIQASSEWTKMVHSYPNLDDFEVLHTTEVIEQAVVISALVIILISAGILVARRGVTWRNLSVPGQLDLIAAAMLNVVLVIVCLFGIMFGSGRGVRALQAALVSLGIMVLAELFHIARAPEPSRLPAESLA